MIENNLKILETFRFVLKLLKRISEKREYKLFINTCVTMTDELDTFSNKSEYLKMRGNLFRMIDELKFIIQAEIRFFLFPLPDIKQETYEMGKKYMSNFLEWFRTEEMVSPEEILKLLNDELYLINEAKKILEKIKFDNEEN